MAIGTIYRASPAIAAAVPAPDPADSADWGLDFIGLLSYLLVEYTRLPAMYPVLAPLQLGKVTLLLAILGVFVSRSPRAAVGNGMVKFSVVLIGAATALSAGMANYRVLPAGDERPGSTH